MPSIRYAALSLAIGPTAGAEIQLTPAGVFKARDGRPAKLPGWKIDAPIAARVIARAAARKNPFVIDYEHQTLNAEKNGQPAPAAGWFNRLEYRDGQGLFATDVEWTARAKAMIDAGEYKFISPVFGFDAATGEVVALQMSALTNDPALDGMDAVLAAAKFTPTHEEHPMKALAILLGLAEDASEADVTAALTALKTKAEAAETQIAALKTQSPDPAKFVPVETMTALQGQVAALTSRLNDGELEEVIQAALSAGKLVPAQEAWARSLGKTDLAALKSFVAASPAIGALQRTQTGGKDPAGLNADGQLSDSALAVCKQMGVAPADFKKTLAAQAAA